MVSFGSNVGSPEIAVLFVQLLKALFVYLILPSLGLIASGLIINFFAHRRSTKKLISVLEKEIESKVDRTKFDRSVERMHGEREKGDAELHEKVNKVKDSFNDAITEVKEKVSWIKGHLEKNSR